MLPFILKGDEDQSHIPRTSIGKILFESLKQHQERIAIVDTDTDESITYSELVVRSAKFALSLRRLGLSRNDTIICISNLNFDVCVALLACLYNGHVLYMINPESTIFELKQHLADADAKLILCCEKCLENIFALQAEIPVIQTIFLLSPNSSKTILCINDLILEEKAEHFEPDTFDPDQTNAVILFSSGTTGLPKGVALNHTNLRMVLLQNCPYYSGLTENDVLISFSTVYTIAGIYAILNLFIGIKIVILSGKFHPGKYLSIIEKYGVTKAFLVPQLVNFFVNSPLVSKYDMSKLKYILVGSAPSSLESLKQLQKKFPHFEITHGYGSTEASGCVILNRSRKNLLSVGKLFPNNLAKIVDMQTGEALGPNKIGEICLKGDSIIKSYYNVAISEEVFDGDGFFRTGDVAYYDEEQFIYIVDRIKDMIKYKAFQVCPSEIENVVSLHPAVDGVAVFGMPDERAGELPCAMVVKKPGVAVSEKEIYDFVADRLSVQKHLRGGIKFVEEIPLNKNMKKDKKLMRTLWANDTNV